MQKNIKDIDKSSKDKKVEKEDRLTGKKQKKAIQLTPSEAYTFFNDEKRKFDRIMKDLQKTELAIGDLDKSIYVISELKDSKDNEIFVNLGLGIYVKAKIEDLKKYYVLDSSKAMLPKTPDKVIKSLKDKKSSALESLKRLQTLHKQTEQNINQLYKFLSHYEQQQKRSNQ